MTARGGGLLAKLKRLLDTSAPLLPLGGPNSIDPDAGAGDEAAKLNGFSGAGVVGVDGFDPSNVKGDLGAVGASVIDELPEGPNEKTAAGVDDGNNGLDASATGAGEFAGAGGVLNENAGFGGSTGLAAGGPKLNGDGAFRNKGGGLEVSLVGRGPPSFAASVFEGPKLNGDDGGAVADSVALAGVLKEKREGDDAGFSVGLLGGPNEKEDGGTISECFHLV